MTTVYVTKYALSDGIRAVEIVETSGHYCWVIWPNQWNNKLLLRQDECWPTLEAAQAEADRLRIKKIASLHKQIDKLTKMTFPVKTLKEKA